MKVAGRRIERALCLHASGELLKEGAQFNSEMQKLQSALRFPKGVFHYKTHAEANRHWEQCQVDTLVAVRQARHGG